MNDATLLLKVQFMDMNGLIQNKELKFFLDHFSKKSDFNPEAFNHLYEDTNEETVIRILAHFNENLKDGAQKIKQSIPVKNIEEIWKAAHKISGSAELLGFKPYADQSRNLSRQMRADSVYENHVSEVETYLAYTADLSRQISAVFPGLTSFL